MNQQRLFLIQTVLETAIPLAGYFAWNWDLSFILLFYLLDALLALGIMIAKGRKRFQFSKQTAELQLFIRRTSVSLVLFGTAIAICAFAVTIIQPELNWVQRIIAFLTYKELGIEQGYVLIPLIVINGIMVYHQQFVLPARYRTITMDSITFAYVKQGFVLLGAAGLFHGLALLVELPEIIVVISFIIGISLYRFFLIRRF
jgi:hypothetical protein